MAVARGGGAAAAEPMVSTLKPAANGGPLYEALADRFAAAVADGTLAPGARLPSLRRVSEQYGVSIATAVQAYRVLEDRRLVDVRPRSGYFVAARRSLSLPEPEPSATAGPAREVVLPGVVREYIDALSRPNTVRLGASIPPTGLFPSQRLAALMAAIGRRRPEHAVTYAVSAGTAELRHAIARRSLDHGCTIAPDDVIVTDGCFEAIALALRAVTRRGDKVAVESPTHFTVLQILENLGLKVIEVASHPRTGVQLDALGEALEGSPDARAVVLMPSFANPLGSCMPDTHKQAAVEMCARRGVALIENDIFGEVPFGGARPLPAKAWDRDGNVMLCSSFTKTLAPGLRVGWIAPGRHRAAVHLLKRSTTYFTPSLPQLAVAQFISTAGYDRHLRQLRAMMADGARRYSEAVAALFPPGCRLTRPTGGFALWVALPPTIDAVELFHRALAHDIVLAPGPLFSNASQYRHFMRLSHAAGWSPQVEAALELVGRLAHEMARGRRPAA